MYPNSSVFKFQQKNVVTFHNAYILLDEYSYYKTISGLYDKNRQDELPEPYRAQGKGVLSERPRHRYRADGTAGRRIRRRQNHPAGDEKIQGRGEARELKE